MNIKPYRAAGVPLVAIENADGAALLASIVSTATNGTNPPIMAWDCVRGLLGANREGQSVADDLNGGQDPAIATGNPVECLRVLQQLPENAIVVLLGIGPIMLDAQSGVVVRQALWNLRDTLKGIGACVVLSVPLGFRLPTDLSNDIVSVVEPLPNQEGIMGIIQSILRDAEVKAPGDQVAKSQDALAGLSAFGAEQSLALSLTKQGIDIGALWERKRRAVEQTPGLSIWRGNETFTDIGGCQNVKEFFGKLIKGRRPPRCIVFIDEIEKALAGSGGSDTSGVSQSMLGSLLTYMQDKNSAGSIFIGPPGAAKSAMAKAIGNEAQCPTIAFDLSGMKGSLVGESEARIRSALATVEAVGQGQVLFIATCNSIGVLPPELRRRYTLGTFFFDLPTEDERKSIWNIWAGKYGLKAGKLPDDEGWTGAEIRQCCDIADRLTCPLGEAASFVVPVSKSCPEKVEELRKAASGKFLSASEPGLYRYEVQARSTARKVKV
jgi:hypothetical protein